ncbi:FAD-dependent oxidoreductase [Thermococcus waiotapuensis]|uniref:FAD-dependent oxidoreductase n=1 Tax=Thermococcus waiotapuensis TaxID=90909 RepID=A0AAE4NW78_9EURY|nr:FAD-dependent oxidoreductase [Thermococcus waiotapuensis]MDV3104426.1 FAD-dependent oxidoreductase [Thermococcus waiotapuensis]
MRPLDLTEKDPSKKITIYFEGRPYEAYEGEKLPVAMLASGVYWLTTSTEGRHRGAFTFGPVPVTVNGVKNVDGRKLKLKNGLRIERQRYDEFQEQVEIDEGKPVIRYVVDVAVIGAGPAGLGVVEEIGGKLTVALIEEKGWLGGDMWLKGVDQEGFGNPRRAIERLSSFPDGVRVFLGTTALGVFDKGEYFLVPAVKEDQLIEFMAKRVVLATGAVDSIMLFENNDYPGVFRRSDALEVINVWGVAPGRKVAVVGAFPEEITQELDRWGIEYVVVPNPKRVEGNDRVERLIDGNGNVYEVDAVIVADGRIPDINPVTQVGGRLHFRHGYYIPILDAEHRIRKGIYVAGSAVSIKPHYANFLEGKLVGAYILREFGLEAEPCLYEEKLKEYEPVARPIPKLPLDGFNGEDVQICGCGVTLGKVDEVVKSGITDLQIIKRLTHLAMGFCQGRFCLFNGALLVSQRSGTPMGELDIPVARPPLKNVKMKVVAGRE